MSFEINRNKLWKAKWENVVRLAKSLNIHGCNCGATECKRKVIEQIVRKCNEV